MFRSLRYCLLFPTLLTAAGLPAVRLEANRGQADSQVQFIARARNQFVYLTRGGLVFDPAGGPSITLTFPNTAPADWQPAGPAIDTATYLIGRDPSQWIRGAPRYERVLWKNAWPGIDVAVYAAGNQLEYDLIAAPHADLRRITLQIPNSRLRKDGSITAGNWTQHPPRLYQAGTTIAGRFEQTAPGQYRLRAAAYDHRLPLIIDPVIEFASYLGGEGLDEITAVGDGWAAGNTRSLGFPGNPALRRNQDVFLCTFAPPVSTAVLPLGCVVFGGSGDEELVAAAPSQNFQFTIAGTTTSRDLPTNTSPASSFYHGGASDGFLATLSSRSAPSGPLSSEYIGGSGEDRIHAMDYSGSSVAGSTDSPDLPVREGVSWQSTPGGGRDGFYWSRGGFLSYLGGSGDDAIYAIGNYSGRVFLAGETRSTGLAFQNGTLQGASDGLLAELQYTATGATLPPLLYRVGGSGEDAITSLAGAPDPRHPFTFRESPLTLALAGHTTSPGLSSGPTTHAGARDAFAALWHVPNRTLLWTRYLGGSGDDAAWAVAQNPAGDVYVGGGTRSTDLPTIEALQPSANGGEDGFFAFLDAEGAIRQLSYYGGAGDDRIRAAFALPTGFARFGGSTNSSSLPVLLPLRPRNDAPEGFVADVSPGYLLGPSSVVLAKDGALELLQVPARTASRVVTYRSSDASRVRLRASGFPPGEAAVSGNGVVLEALSDSGEVDIIASAPEMLPKTIRVRLYPGAFFSAGYTPSLLSTSAAPVRLSAWYHAVDPATGNALGHSLALRGDITPPLFRWTSSDPSVLRIGYHNNGSPLAYPQSPGQATVRFSADGFSVADDGFPFTVAPPTPRLPNELRIARDFQAFLDIFAIAAAFNRRGTLTARSEDPTRLLIAAGPTMPGSAQATIDLSNFNTRLYFQALDGSGQVRVLFSSTEFPGEVPFPITLEEPILRAGAPRPPDFISTDLELAPPNTFVLSTQLLTGTTAQQRRPGAPDLFVRIRNSAPHIVALNRDTIRVGDASEQFILRPVAEGTAELTVDTIPGTVRVLTPTLTVRVRPLPTPAATSLGNLPRRIFAGKDLLASVAFGHLGGPVTVTVGDPSLLQILSSSTGTSQLTTSAVNGSVSFSVYGVRPGQTSLTIQFDTGERGQIPVDVLASGPVPDFLSPGQLAIRAYAIDEASGVAISRQPLRPGVSMDVSLRTEGAITLSANRVTLSAANPLAPVAFTPAQPTDAAVIAEPAAGSGFVFSRSSRLEFTRPAPSAFAPPVRSLLLRLDELYRLSMNLPRGATLTSSDGLKLGLSLSPAAPFARSIATVEAGAPVYLHALAAEDDATITIQAPFADTTQIGIIFAPPSISVSSPPGPGIPVGRTVDLQVIHEPSTRRPGAPAPGPITLRSSDPTVLEVSATFLDSSGSVRLIARKEGLAQIMITPPPGVVAPAPLWIPVTPAPALPLAAWPLGLQAVTNAGTAAVAR